MALAARANVASTRGFLGKRVSRVSNGCRVVMRAGNWLPGKHYNVARVLFAGSDAPAWLPDNLPGNYGFDPLGLSKDPASLTRFQESEVFHCRWAMLGAAGVLGVEALGFGNWYDAPLWAINGGSPTWFGVKVPFDLNTLLAIEFVAMAAAESRRGDEPDAEKRTYPGGAFDPLNFAKGNVDDLKLKEIKNGRLAMLACLGFVAQHAATGKTPLQALGEHISSPWNAK
ncbi:light-harvesting protein of photosystem I [Scenedesmus sp. NREL 46B-D3]|nr:light-harvesting protein of photosystem I [Scenedesmus sp. NREL 46B-D3]